MLHPNVDKGILASFKWLGLLALLVLLVGMGISVYKKIPKDPPPPPGGGAAAMTATSGWREVKRVSAPRDDWSDGVDVTRKSFNVYPAKGGCYRLKANGKMVTNGAGKHEICNGDDIAGGRNTDPRLVLKFQSVEETDLDMVVELFPKPSKI